MKLYNVLTLAIADDEMTNVTRMVFRQKSDISEFSMTLIQRFY